MLLFTWSDNIYLFCFSNFKSIITFLWMVCDRNMWPDLQKGSSTHIKFTKTACLLCASFEKIHLTTINLQTNKIVQSKRPFLSDYVKYFCEQYGNQASWTNDESIVETRPYLHFLELLGLLVDVQHSNLKLSIMLFKTRKSMFLSLPQISHKFPSAFIVQIYGWQLY